MAQGSIKRLISDQGFGFILPDVGETDAHDVFFRQGDVQGAGYSALREGDRVTFELSTDGRRGTPSAMQVQLVSSEGRAHYSKIGRALYRPS